MLLEQVLHAEQVLAVVVGQEPHLQLLHRVEDVDHLLEVVLQLQGKFQSLSPGLEKLQKEIPEPENVVFARIDPLDVVIVFGLEFVGDGDDGLNAFLVGKDVRLDGLVLLGGGLDSSEVEAKVVLASML